MEPKRIGQNKYKITIELGYDILGNRKRKTINFTGTKSEAIKREAELKTEFYHLFLLCHKSGNFTDKECSTSLSPIMMMKRSRTTQWAQWVKRNK